MIKVNKCAWIAACSIVIASCNQTKTDKEKTDASKTVKPKIETIQEANPYIKIAQKDSLGKDVENNKQKLYLTFDDGPNPGTRIVIDALKEYKLPATFYMIGLHCYYGPMQEGLWQEVNKVPFFEVTNHSFTHAYKNRFATFYNDVPGAVQDFIRNQDSLKFNNTIVRGPGSNVWRLPGTYIDHKFGKRTQVMDSLFSLGFYITGWDWEWEHRNNKAKQSATTLYSEVKSMFTQQKLNKQNHLVLLTHDAIFSDTADAAQLRQFFGLIKADTAIELRTISQYPGAAGAFK